MSAELAFKPSPARMRGVCGHVGKDSPLEKKNTSKRKKLDGLEAKTVAPEIGGQEEDSAAQTESYCGLKKWISSEEHISVLQRTQV